MHIECFSNHGIKYLRLAESVRRPSKKNPNKISTYKEIIFNIGPLSRFDDGKPDYLERLRKSFSEGKPLIASLTKYIANNSNSSERDAYLAEHSADSRCCAELILDPIYRGLGMPALCSTLKNQSKIEYDLVGIVRKLVYSRMLYPSSKWSVATDDKNYIWPLADDGKNPFNVYDSLSVLYEHRDKFFKRINSSIDKKIKRDYSVLFYDVTNFYFAIDDPDEDELDEDGEIIHSGLRKPGVSKEKRQSPIVQMSLFMDNEGLPIAMDQFPGNTLDHLTAIPSYNATVKKLGYKGRFIFVADRGICYGPLMHTLRDSGNGYIVGKSLRKCSQAHQAWAIDQEGYQDIGPDFKYKSKVLEELVTDAQGNKRKIKHKVVVFWSRAHYERERREHQSFLEFIEKLKKTPNSFRVSAAESKSIKRFLSKEVVHKGTGEILESKDLLANIDEEKLERWTGLMGYFQIASSEIEMNDLEIIDKYRGLSQIEDQFREMKGTLETRPVYVSTERHIYAHFLTCFIALVMMRLIQRKYTQHYPPAPDDMRRWTYGMTGDTLTEALRRMQLIQIGKDSYWTNHFDDKDVAQLLDAYGIDRKQRIYTKAEFRQLKKTIAPF